MTELRHMIELQTMARIPEWFERLDPILEVLRGSNLEWLGRTEIKALFRASERAGIRLLHKFGAVERNDALSLPRSELLSQLEAIRSGSTYTAFLGQRIKIAQHLNTAREQAAARQFRVRPPERERRLKDLPGTITWRRISGAPGRFEILYTDGADLMQQLAQFLTAAGLNRQDFFEGTEAAHDPDSL